MKHFLSLLFIVLSSAVYSSDHKDILTFSGNKFDNEELISFSNFKGKMIYVDFWASWCTPCLKSIPFMEKLKRKYADKDLMIVAINIDEFKSDAIKFLKSKPISFLNLYDPNGEIAKPLKVTKMPTSFLFDKSGNLLFKHVGFNDEYAAELSTYIEKKLSSK